QTIAAAEAGKHGLCEKPMGMDAAECDRMIAACRAHRVRLGVAYYRHFYPGGARIRALVSHVAIRDPGFAEMRPVARVDAEPGHPRGWLLVPAMSGGGPMIDFGCHRLEVLLNLFGGVRRLERLTANVAFDRPVEDTAAVLLQFERGPVASLAVTHGSREKQDTLHVFGTRGALHCDDLNAGVLRIADADGERREVHPPAANVHRPLIDDFVDAAMSGRDPAVNGAAGRAVSALVDAIYG